MSYSLIVDYFSLSLLSTLPMSSDNIVCVCVCVQSFSCVRLFATPWTVARRLLSPWNSPGKNTGVGGHFLLQGISPAQGWSLYIFDSLKFSHHIFHGLPETLTNCPFSARCSSRFQEVFRRFCSFPTPPPAPPLVKNKNS